MSQSIQTIQDALDRLSVGGTLERDEARRVMDLMLAGEATPVQIAAFLMGLRVRGEREDEIVGLVEGMRAAAVKLESSRENVVDLCGTGGDRSDTFNISTAASLGVAGAGVPVAKHGNRAASSQCGSADVLEALGIPVELPVDKARQSLDDIGFTFLFARLYHPAMKHVAPVRQEMRVRTVFNLMGPLSSPAGVKHQLIGVFDDTFRPALGRVLHGLGAQRAWVVHGDGGLDELSLSGPTKVTECGPDGVRELSVDPGDAGLSTASQDALRGGDAATNAKIIEAVLGGEEGAPRDAVVLNAAAALLIGGAASDLRQGAERAAEAIDSGSAQKIVEQLRSFS